MLTSAVNPALRVGVIFGNHSHTTLLAWTVCKLFFSKIT